MPTNHSNNQLNKIEVMFIAAEAEPYVKVGGLGDVAGALPRALNQLNQIQMTKVSVRLFLPYHQTIKDKKIKTELITDFTIPTLEGDKTGKCYFFEDEGLKVYLIDGEPVKKAKHIYDNRSDIIGDLYTFFSLSLYQIIKNISWQPDIIHANDWHTALTIYATSIRNKLKSQRKKYHTVLSIHNLQYMGFESKDLLKFYKIPVRRKSFLPAWSKRLPLPLGIDTAEKVVTVSPTYAKEIQTAKYGCGLENYFKDAKIPLSGILNGIDDNYWNPQTDIHINTNYNINSLAKRQSNKKQLLNEFTLDTNLSIPLLVIISRLEYQKGIDIAIESLKIFKAQQWNLVILGSGNPQLEESCQHLYSQFPEKVRVVSRFDEQLAHKLYASGDVLLMPSRYEPCGITQMIAMRYGCVPIANSTGGLKDTICDGKDQTKQTGFLIKKSSPAELSNTLMRAITIFINNKDQWGTVQINGMEKDFSWSNSALKYANLYRQLLQ